MKIYVVINKKTGEYFAKREVRRWTNKWAKASFYGTIGAARGVATYATDAMKTPAHALPFDAKDINPCADCSHYEDGVYKICDETIGMFSEDTGRNCKDFDYVNIYD